MNMKSAVMSFLVAALVSLNASAASYTREIYSPDGLYQGDTLMSANGKYKLLLQGDGNLVLSRIADNALVWANYAFGTTVVVVQPDGNFVAYNTNTTPVKAVWDAKTGGKAGSGPMPVSLQLADDGSLNLYSTGGSLIWSTVPDATCVGGGRMSLYPVCMTAYYPNYTNYVPGCTYNDALAYAYAHYYPYYYPGVCR